MTATETAIVVRPPTVREVETLATHFANSGFFSDSRGLSQAVTKILAGQELGIGPVTAMTGIYIVKGRVTLSANLIGAAIKRSGKYNYRVKSLTDEGCTIAFFEGGSPIGESSFSMEDAERAGLAKGDNWRNYPRNMLFARALSNGAKWYCPDMFGGPVYTPDELGMVVDGETGEIIGETAAEPVKVKVVDEPKPAKVSNEWNTESWATLMTYATNKLGYPGEKDVLAGLRCLTRSEAETMHQTPREALQYLQDRKRQEAAAAQSQG